MADRYWVGGSATWDGTAGSKWSTTSGGAGGAAVPTSADDVFFNAASGAVTVDIGSSGVDALNLNFTGFTGTFTSMSAGQVRIYGNLTFSAGMTVDPNASHRLVFSATTTGKTINFAGKFVHEVEFNGAGGGWTLSSACSSNFFYVNDGTFNTGNFAVTTADIEFYGGTVNLGSSVVTLSAPDISYGLLVSDGATLNAGTSRIVIDHAGASTVYLQFGPGVTIYDLEVAAENAAVLNVTCNDFDLHDLILNPTACLLTDRRTGSPIALTVGGTIDATGTANNYISINAPHGSDNLDFVCASGTINTEYVIIHNSDASGGATFNADGNSIDAGGNTGWNFASPGGGGTIARFSAV